MTWPIPTLPKNWTNSSPQVDAHPLAHNQLADAVNELAAHVTTGESGLAAHLADTGDAHDASAISTVAFSNMFASASNVQTVLAALQGVMNVAGDFASLPAPASAFMKLYVAAGSVYWSDGNNWLQIYGPGVTPSVTPWVPLPLIAPWTAYGGGTFGGVPYYRKIGDMVQLKGAIGGAGTAPDTYFATLPVGCRPVVVLVMPTVTADLFSVLRAHPDGRLQVGPFAEWYNLNGIQYSVSQYETPTLLPADAEPEAEAEAKPKRARKKAVT